MYKHNHKLIVLAAALLLLTAAGAACLFLYLSHSKSGFSDMNPQTDDGKMAGDLVRLSESNYEAVLLSMHSPGQFQEEDFIHFRGINTLVTSHAILDTAELSAYLDCILNSGNAVTNLYLCLDPELLWTGVGQNSAAWKTNLQEHLYAFLEAHPDISFEILLPYPYLDYWLELEADKLDTLITLYHTLADELCAYSNAKVFFPGYEYWLIVNPDNYSNTFFDANEIITQKIFLFSFCDSQYQITPENEAYYWSSLRELIIREKTTPTFYPDLSDWCLVFFGDSVLGNFPGSFSIPGYVAGLSDAAVYNFAIGGTSAASRGGDALDFPNIIDDFLAENTSPSGSGMLFTPGGTEDENLNQKRLCFVINYGFNDYFSGTPMENPQNPYDIATYKGGLRSCIAKLQTAFPNADFILITPTHTGYFNNGMEIKSAEGEVLSAYVDATREISEEFNLFFVDNYNNYVITDENLIQYLSDGCHPNEQGRLLLATTLMYFIHGEMVN